MTLRPANGLHDRQRSKSAPFAMRWTLLAGLLAALVAASSTSWAETRDVSESGWVVASPTLGPNIELPKRSDRIAIEFSLQDPNLKFKSPNPRAAKEPVHTSRRPIPARRDTRSPRLIAPNSSHRNGKSDKGLDSPIREDLDYEATVDSGEGAEAPKELSPNLETHGPITPLPANSAEQDAAPDPSTAADTPPADDTPAKRSPPVKEPSYPPSDSSPATEDESTQDDVTPEDDSDFSDDGLVEEQAAPAPPPQPLSRRQEQLQPKLRRVLSAYYKRALNTREHDPWEAMHGMLAYEVHSRILRDGPMGQPVTTVGWLCFNRPCKGQTMLYVNPENELRVKVGVGLQGHEGQFLAMLAQSKVPSDYPIRIGDHRFTVADLVGAEQKTCYPKDELTFKLIALMHYLDSDETWVNDQGMTWDIPRLIREEMEQPIRGAACGGTHRLSGLSLAVKKRVQRGEPLDGEYANADEFVRKYQAYAFRLQNRDGSLSTEWFRGSGSDPDINRRVKTTGHILEWLLYSLDDEELDNPRTFRAVNYLTNLMYSNYRQPWEIGPMSHALHALMIYDQRVYQPHDGAEHVASNTFHMNGPVDRRTPFGDGKQDDDSSWGIFGGRRR